jgi:hypothetical protein
MKMVLPALAVLDDSYTMDNEVFTLELNQGFL